MRRLFPILALAATLPTAAAAQQSTDGPYVLHEYVEDLDVQGGSGAGGAEPRVDADDFFVPGEPPALSLETRPGEPIYDKDGPNFDRPIDTPYGDLSPYASSNKLDERTDRVDSLTYFASFEPSVIPYKRVVAKNHAVRRGLDQYALEVYSPQRFPVAIDTMPTEPSDVFWGTFLLRIEPGRVHPIASISPDQKLLQVVVEPDIPIEIERDGADNFFVRSSQSGLVRLNIQLAVPSFYFGGPFPEVGWNEFPARVTPELDPDLQAHALRIAQKVGFTKTDSPARTIVKMVEYFRDFDARPFPDDLKGGDLLESISVNSIGVCRHRSLAFVFLARAMGIPSRYVYNEAHAFVEVFWPIGGWRRLDLGGAANELNASANEGRKVHDPGDDGLPTPKRFIEEQEKMAHNGWDPPESARGQQQAAGGNNGGNGTAANESGTNGSEEAPPAAATQTSEPPVFQEPAADERTEAVLRIVTATASVRRGDVMQLEATLADSNGRPLADRTVEVYLGAVGSTSARSARRLGEARTSRDGRVRTTVSIPAEHAIGRWSLFLLFPGDSAYKPAVAE